MSIRMRLVLSYIAMLIVPIVLSIVAAALIMIFFIGDLRTLYQVTDNHRNPFTDIMEQEAAITADIKLMSAREPEMLMEDAVAEELDSRLHKINMNLIVRKNDELLYISPNLSKTRDYNRLPAYGGSSIKENDIRERLIITRQVDFLLSGQERASVFIVTDANTFQKYVHQYAKWLFIALLLILILTNGALTYFVSRSIIRPLKALKQAAEEIKEGNLDFEVKPQSKDEIGELSTAFEEMRSKLKHSIGLQLQYDENRKELISNISHDLKTPVTAIKGYVEGIMDGVADSPDKLERYVKTIYNKANDMDRLIDELFLFSKLDLGKIPFHFERVDLGQYLEDCVQELYFDMEKKGVKLEPENAPSAPLYVKADREKLKRVLLNIFENAVKYMDKDEGNIRLKVQEIEGNAIVSIEDNGQGISAEALPHIFDRFYRADPSRNTATGGSGLGLAIAKQIVEEHGGMIWAASEIEQGTKIFIMLPIWSKP
ncbi:sensor histidine kinase [Paenibacillus eucommiae]|uniref:histidine kinase n=1 Tax=Paenibacillus eucommiae TaxID=1355755 RepID=A0ABS4IXS4_9BACL|nr:HAMP domain-containing sensor histidine kinase [Paenibacillus eucommiae]MBP1992393.1 signal transduction histidine kinase [Paenibacillus eucommiae]